ncbi:Hypp8438 [Branchiostoma lanceolatum]|uniref:Hypp8438 protein n=1 Tax=Branchiostoma lanceolatum TaxID=7740 RepID=A0A8J9Z7M2_BRALA|nr:Hypp8438 [Branchiostoma lanceolatum]
MGTAVTKFSTQDMPGKKLFSASAAAAAGMVTVKAAPMGAKACAYTSPDETSIDKAYKVYNASCGSCHTGG